MFSEYILAALTIGVVSFTLLLFKWLKRKKSIFTPEERKLVNFYNMNMFPLFVEHFHKFKINPNISDYVRFSRFFVIRPFFLKNE